MSDLDSQIEQIEKLDALRRQARMLRGSALSVLSEEPYTADRRGWRDPGDYVEKALILRALRGQVQGKSKDTSERLDKELSSLVLTDLEGANEAIRGPGDHVPVLRSAVVMQALVKIPCHALSKTTLSCFYQIIRELYEVVPPASAAGSAKAGESALASAFITGECTKALLTLRQALLQTAKAVELLYKAVIRTTAEPMTVITSWSDQEGLFRLEALRVSLASLRPDLAVTLPSGKEETPRDLLKDLLIEFSKLPKVEDLFPNSGGSKKSAAPEPAVQATANLDVTTPHLAAASKKIASDAVDRLLKILTGLGDFVTGIDGPLDTLGEVISSQLKTAAQMVRNLLDPVERYASSVIDRELAAASAHLGRTVDGAELVFSAALLGSLSGWNHPKVKSAYELVHTLLSPDGRLLSIRPFDVLTKGYRLHVTTLEVTRRLADLLSNLDVEPEPAFIERLMRPFEDTRAISQNSSAPGWAADPPGPKRESEWWVTSLAVDALDCVIGMLDETINRHVLRHFSVRRPADLKLSLDQLFYPDFGLSARRSDESVAIKLQHLRAHVSGVGSRDEPLFSLILYGPPGTGKTTLVEALAKSADAPFIEITPSDILVGGQEAVERRTRLVFIALSMLTRAVILFDEFDPILQDRGRKKGNDLPRTVFEFLTPGLLPKLKKLHDAAKENQLSYVLATNFVYKLDRAAIRKGRFDSKHGIYPPDIVSRVGRLMDQFQRWKQRALTDDESQRVLDVLKKTRSAPMDQIGRLGWYTAPPGSSATTSAFDYIENGGDNLAEVAPEAEFEKERDKRKAELVSEQRKGSRERGVNAEFAEEYWKDWQTVEKWDKRLTDGALRRKPDWNALVDNWTREAN